MICRQSNCDSTRGGWLLSELGGNIHIYVYICTCIYLRRKDLLLANGSCFAKAR